MRDLMFIYELIEDTHSTSLPLPPPLPLPLLLSVPLTTNPLLSNDSCTFLL